MTVSVIVPVYNLENHISVCVNSLLSQSFCEEYEIILVDDGSSDSSLAVMTEIASQSSKIKLISQKNRGVSAARNTGLDAANGKYIMFVDGDDILPKGAIETLVSAIRMRENSVLASGKHLRIPDSASLEESGGEVISVSNCKERAKMLLLGKYPMSCCTKLFVREKISSLRFPEGYSVNEDKYFLLRYLLQNDGETVDTDRVVYGYLIREGSASLSDFSSKNLDMIRLSEAAVQEIWELYPEISDEARYNNLVSHLAVLKKLIRSDSIRENKAIFDEIRKKVFKISKTVSMNIPRVHKLELIALRIGRTPYSICVRLFDKKAKRYIRRESNT